MSQSIWVYLDHFQGNVSLNSWEALGAGMFLARQAGGRITAIIFGSSVEKLAEEAIKRGADTVLIANDSTLDDFRSEPYATLIAGVSQNANPDVILFPNTARGRELAAMIAVDLKTGVLPDVTALEQKDGQILATRPIYAGKLLAKVTCSSRPVVITLRARSFSAPVSQEDRTGDVQRIEPNLSENEISTRVERYVQADSKVTLNDASVVVSGGRGVVNNPALKPPPDLDANQIEKWKAQQGFELIAKLADVLGGAVGASRAAVDAGYISYPHQVGQTGKIISPDLYIACGISGAIQHLAGMRTSKVIVAINRDPDAPIFKLARYGVVGDLYEILPALTEVFRSRLNR